MKKREREREYPVPSVCLQCLQRALFIFSYFFSSVSSFACLPSSAAAEHISSLLFSPSLPLPPLLQQRLCSVSPLLYPLSLFAQTQPTEQRVCSVCNCLNSLQQQQSFPGEYSPSSLSLSLISLSLSARRQRTRKWFVVFFFFPLWLQCTAHTAFPPCQQQQQCILSSSGSSTPSPGSLAPSAPEHSCAGSSIQQQQLRHSSPLLFSSLSLSTPPQQHSSNWAPLLDPLLASSSFSVLERD